MSTDARSVDFVTSNEQLVRQRIFDGVIPETAAYRELWELEKAQRSAEWQRFVEYRDRVSKIINRLSQET